MAPTGFLAINHTQVAMSLCHFSYAVPRRERPAGSVRFRWVKALTSIEITQLADRIAKRVARQDAHHPWCAPAVNRLADSSKRWQILSCKHLTEPPQLEESTF
jgi:hypothetical protein